MQRPMEGVKMEHQEAIKQDPKGAEHTQASVSVFFISLSLPGTQSCPKSSGPHPRTHNGKGRW